MTQPDNQAIAIDCAKVVEILRIPLVGTEIEKKNIFDQQENVFQKIITKFKDTDDDKGRLNAIEAGIAEEITNIIESRELISITVTHIESLEYLTYPGSFENRQLLYEKKNPYPALIRLLDHQNSEIVLHAISTIGSILLGGIGTTKDQEQHPHFQSIEECNGIQKIYSLFQQSQVKIIKDKTAVYFGRLFRARAILDKEMQVSVVSYLKSIISDTDEWARSNSVLAITFLAQHEDNYTEIMKGFDPLTIIQDLSQPITGNDEERKQIQRKKNLDCVLLQIMIDKTKNDINLMKRLTDAGIIEALLYYFETQDLNMLTCASIRIFNKIKPSAKGLIDKLKEERKYYPSILRLFRSSDLQFLSQAYYLIDLDIAEGADLAKDNSPNPIFEKISECEGTKIIFDLFERNLSKDSKDNAANLLSMLFIHQEFPNAIMRKEIISYYINPLINSNCDGQEIDIWSLKEIAKVVGNHEEILKDNFINKAVKAISDTTEKVLFEFLEIIIDIGTDQTRKQIQYELLIAKIQYLCKTQGQYKPKKIFLLIPKINSQAQNHKELVQTEKQQQQVKK